MQGIYTYIPETKYVPREYSVAAILLLLFMVLISLVPGYYYYYYFYKYKRMEARLFLATEVVNVTFIRNIFILKERLVR